MPKIYIVILNYNGWKDSQECLESILNLDYSNYQIILIDNNSPNDSMSHLIDWANGKEKAIVENPTLKKCSTPEINKPIDYVLYENKLVLKATPQEETLPNKQVVFIQSGENDGFAAGNNIGIQYALNQKDTDYIWCLNNDTVIEPDALTELVNKAKQYKKNNQKIGIIGSKLMYYHAPDMIQAIGGKYSKWLARSTHFGAFEKDNGQFDNEEVVKSITYPVGASMFVDIDFIKDVGLMCEDYFLYFEENDWVQRGKQKGWSIGYCWKSKIYHKEGKSIGTNEAKNEKSLFADYHLMRSRLIFTRKFYPIVYILIKTSLPLILLKRILTKQWHTVPVIIKAFERTSNRVFK